jgi:maltokinase
VADGTALLERLEGERWFAGKARNPVSAAVRAELEAGDGTLRIVEVEYAAGEPERYAVPAGKPLWGPLLRLLGEGPRSGFSWRGPAAPASTAERPLVVDQSNTSFVLDGGVLVKCYRLLWPGVHPEVELVTFLSDRFAGVPRALGSIHYVDDSGEYAIALLQELVPEAEDGWAWCQRLVADAAAGVVIDAGWAAEAGTLTAALHDALADLGAEPSSSDELARRKAKAEEEVEAVARLLPAGRAAELRAGLAGFACAEGAVVSRVHGDYHVGQLLRSPAGYRVIDFEGEPTRPLEERRTPDFPLRDVASMLRSIDHVPLWALRGQPELQERGTAWSEASRAAFLDGYGKPLDRSLLRALELEKAAYEFGYAEAFLPEWRPVAEAGLELLLARDVDE